MTPAIHIVDAAAAARAEGGTPAVTVIPHTYPDLGPPPPPPPPLPLIDQIATTGPLTSSEDATGRLTISLPSATDTSGGAMSAADKVKLDGMSGTGGVTRFIWHQDVAAATWTINHPLHSYPDVTVITSAGEQVEVDYQYVTLDQVVILAASAFGGLAILT